MQAALLLLFLVTPALVIYAAHHQRWVHRLGVVVVCYGLGMLIGSSGLVPEAGRGVAPMLAEVTVVLALPMLLFSLDIRQWPKVAGKALLSLLFAVTVVTAIATALFFAYRDNPAAANLAAMSVGVYSGGTPNLAAIKTGLEIPNDQYLTFHSLDAVVGSIYFLVMLTVGVPFFRALLAGSEPAGDDARLEQEATHGVDQDDYRPLLERGNIRQVVAPVALSALVVAISLGLAELLAVIAGGEPNSAVLIIALTTLGMVFSLHRRARGLALSYRMGMYLIYVFCLAVSSMVSPEKFADLDPTVAVFLGVVVFGGLALHALLCRLVGIDGDTFMVTSVAAVASPPFVPLMARALDNPGAILPGMTTGVIGYALGSYLGISLGLYLQGLQ
jgi:uncharacterized membrane protein